VSEILLYGGIAIIGLAVVAGLIFIFVMWTLKRKLKAKLDAEYGKERFR